jgi:flagellin-like protein
MKSGRSETAVSPVIGTILLVAITVVLVAIMSVLVMNTSAGLDPKKEVALTVTTYQAQAPDTLYYNGIRVTTTTGIMLVFYGGRDFQDLERVSVLVNGKPTFNGGTAKNIDFDGKEPGQTGAYGEHVLHAPIVIGKPYKFRLSTDSNNSTKFLGFGEIWAELVVIAGFTDGSEQVIYKDYLNIKPLVI